MSAYVAFLRAVNVGGNNKVPMAHLREALAAAGLEEVRTLLQSGNVVFQSSRTAEAAAEAVGVAIEETFGLQIGVVVRSASQLTAVAGANPFLEEDPGRDPKTLHVVFLSDRPAAGAAAKLNPDRSPPDAVVVKGSELFLSYPARSGNSRLTLDYLEKVLGVRGTARNWRTVQRVAAAFGS